MLDLHNSTYLALHFLIIVFSLVLLTDEMVRVVPTELNCISGDLVQKQLSDIGFA